MRIKKEAPGLHGGEQGALSFDCTGKGNEKKPSEGIRRKKSDAVKRLQRLADAEARRKYPNTPDYVLAPRKYDDRTANGLTKCIIDYLKFNGCQAERINTTGRPVDRRKTYTDVLGFTRTIGGFEWVYGSSTNGSADISATIAGRSVKIEVKVGQDRQSDAQKKYQAEVVNAGGVYYIARDFAGFEEWYQNNSNSGSLWQTNKNDSSTSR